MSDWQEMSLNDIAHINPSESIGKGTSAKKVAMEFVQPFTKKIPGYSIEEYKGGMKFRNGDTLVARITPSLENGKTAFVDILDEGEVGFGSTEFIVLRARENQATENFVYYLARSPEFRDIAILSMTGSSGRQRVQTDVVSNYLFDIPPLSEQKAITAVLASLDDKIDLLHRQNKTLESLAQTLFRHWFIDGAEDDWEAVTVGDFAQINASTVQRNYEHDLIEYLDTGSITEGKVSGFQQYTLKDAPSRAKRLVQHNDIVYSTVRPNQRHYGIVKNPQPNLVVSTGFCVITCDKIDPHFVYILLTQPDMTEYLHSIAEGSTSAYPSLKPSDIASLEFQLPPKRRLDMFSTIAQSCWEKIDRNSSQIRTLENLRDTLLPKLMSGEVRVRL